MEILPAIDLRGGKVVRLRQGDPNAQTIYSEQPAEVARQWAVQGARWLHVVNLDGAFGASKAECALEEILRAVQLPVQFGGGLRDLASIERALSLGTARVVLGTAAVQQPALVEEAVARFGADYIVVGLDARAGLVATHGWQAQSSRPVLAVAKHMYELGVTRLVYTDIERDGMMQGANVEATRALARVCGIKVIASGGVSSLDDVRKLKAAECDGVEGAIIGQALYTGAIRLQEAVRIADDGNVRDC